MNDPFEITQMSSEEERHRNAEQALQNDPMLKLLQGNLVSLLKDMPILLISSESIQLLLRAYSIAIQDRKDYILSKFGLSAQRSGFIMPDWNISQQTLHTSASIWAEIEQNIPDGTPLL